MGEVVPASGLAIGAPEFLRQVRFDQVGRGFGGHLIIQPGRSPDRADALVWALSELMMNRKPGPRVRSLWG